MQMQNSIFFQVIFLSESLERVGLSRWERKTSQVSGGALTKIPRFLYSRIYISLGEGLMGMSGERAEEEKWADLWVLLVEELPWRILHP